MATTKNQSALSGIGGSSELRSRLLFVLFALIIFRTGSHITIPGVDPRVMADLFAQQSSGILGMLNMFGGGALSRMSLFALGVMPYISASIIMQLMTHVVPRFEQLRKEGESGRRVITKYTRYGTLVLASVQAIGIAIALQNQGAGGQSVVFLTGPGFVLTAAITLVTGTMFLMWLGEQITERGIGNGISILIFAGIVAGLPAAIGGTLQLSRTGELNFIVVILLFAMVLAVTAFVVFVERHNPVSCNAWRYCDKQYKFAAEHNCFYTSARPACLYSSVCFGDYILLFFLYRAGIQCKRNCRQSEEVGRVHPGYTAG